MAQDLEIRRAKPGDLAAIASLVKEAGPSNAHEANAKGWLLSKGLWLAIQDDRLVGAAAWQAENLVAVTDVFHVAPARCRADVGCRLLQTIETEAKVLMCEVHVVALPSPLPEAVRALLLEQGYEPKEAADLHRIWQEVLDDLVGEGPELMVKALRDRRVMAPV